MSSEFAEGPPKKILLATDLSARCDRAFDRAVFLADEWKAQLVVVHVMEDGSRAAHELEPMPSWRRPANPQRLAEFRVRADMHELFSDCVVVIEKGDTAEAVMRTAEAHRCDLIVTGVARDELLGRVALGGTVDRLARRSRVPILVVRRRGQRPYHHVVLATDFSASSRHALTAAVHLFPRQVLTIFNAYDVPLSGLVSDPAKYRREYRDVVAADCNAFLDGFELPGARSQKPEILLEQGEPDQLLHEYAQERDIDVVALGTHGHSALFEMLIGSVARRLINTLPCDVLIIPEPRANAGG